MKILLATSKKYAKSIISVITALVPRPHILVISYDDEVEVLAKTQGLEFVKIKDIEKLYKMEKLEEYDIAIIALDDDMLNIAVTRVAKSMGIPVTIMILYNDMNRDIALKEGAQSIINIGNFISSSLKLLLASDTWVILEVEPILRISIAFHRIVKRSVLGITLEIIRGSIELSETQVMAISRTGEIIGNKEPLENGDMVIIVGVWDKVLKTITKIENMFKRYEQLYSHKYPEAYRVGGYW